MRNNGNNQLPPNFQISPPNVEKLIRYGKDLGDGHIVYAKIFVSGTEISKETNIEVQINQKDLSHTTFTIICPLEAFNERAREPLANSKKLGGSTITVQMVQFGQSVSLFSGLVSDISHRHSADAKQSVVIFGHSPTIIMDAAIRNRSFENMTLEDIFKKVTSEYIRNDLRFEINPLLKNILPYTVQNETDWQFLVRLAQRYGEYLQWNGEKLILGRFKGKVVEMLQNQDFNEYELKMQTKPQFFSISTYDNSSAQQYTADSESIFQFSLSNPYQLKAIESSKHLYPQESEYFYYGSLLQNKEQELKSLIERQKKANQSITVLTAKSHTPDLRLGDIVKMKVWIPEDSLFGTEGYPIESYRICEIKHYHSPAKGYTNEFMAVPQDQEVPFYMDYKAVPRSPEQSAVVVDNNDPEQLNRVKVHFFWQQQGQSTPWIKLSQPYAAGGFGGHIIPEIDTEVLVGFVNQNAEVPYVISSLYNGNQKSGYHTPDNDIKALHTRSTRRVVNDAEGSILEEDAAKSYIKLKGDGKLYIKAKEITIDAEDVYFNVGNNMVLNIMTRLFIFTPYLKQIVSGVLNIFSGQALISSKETLNLQSKNLSVAGTDKVFVHSDKEAIFNSLGTASMKGENKSIFTNISDPFKKKDEEEIALATIYFRPLDSWKGEFGFDWLREKDNGLAAEPDYQTIIESGYKDGVNNLSNIEAYIKLKTEYKTIPIRKKAPLLQGEYFVPYLTLYPKKYVDRLLEPSIQVKPKYEAELKVLVEIDEDLSYIEFEYNEAFFAIDKKILQDKNKTSGLVVSSDVSINITCEKEFSKDQSIKIYAYPKGSTVMSLAEKKVHRKLAGEIIVLANDDEHRKKDKFVLVPVRSNIDGDENVGTFSPSEKKRLQNFLHQSLVTLEIKNGEELDISADEKFKIKTDTSGNKIYGEYIFENLTGDPKKTDGNINEDKSGIFSYIRNEYIRQHPEYTDYYTMFSFDENTYDSYNDPAIGTAGAVPGQVQKISIRNVFLFNGLFGNTRGDSTIAHEGLHGLGLYHTHKDGASIKKPDIKYVYPNGNMDSIKSTDNIMSYGASVKKSTWKWQWDIVRKNII